MISLGPADVVDFLRRTGSYTEKPDHVEVIETHISWVFLTDRFAYKLKKPVRFEFVDFSTPALRCKACQEEVRLNRRLAADVYLKVVPVTHDLRGRLTLGGDGAPVDWVVKMRRLPADQTLECLARQHRLTERQVDDVATVLADFYARAAPLIVRPETYRAEIERHVRANAAELARPEHGADTAAVRRIHAAQLRYLRLQRALFDERVCDGRIVEGHGDLRPEHIYFEAARPSIIDCIEFSTELRTLDVADELSFLAMECDRLGVDSVGARVIDHYCRSSGDAIPDSLVRFYKAYRACVRAKVAALRACQLPLAQREPLAVLQAQYLGRADEYAHRLGPPLVLIVHGLMGTGKSTLAAALGESLALDVLSTDTIRQELLPPASQPVDYNEGRYAREVRQQVYDLLLRRARRKLEQGTSVVLDGAFLTQSLRQRAVEVARQAGAVPLLIRCECSAAVAQSRIAARLCNGNSASEARPDLYALQQQEDEPPAADLPLLTIDTTTALAGQNDAVIERLTAETARAQTAPCL